MEQYLCIGTYTEEILFGTGELFRGKGKGVSIAIFKDGKIKKIQDFYVKNSSFLCIDEELQKIYTVNETKEYMGRSGGGVTQLSYDSEGNMKREKTYNTAGSDPCHIVKSPDGTFLAISNFASGSVSIFYLDEQGNITGEKDLFVHKGSSSDPIRQRGPHAHSAIFSPDGHYMYVPDLGIDIVKAYRWEKNRIIPVPTADIYLPMGSGPRYGEFSPDGKHFYLMNELSSQVMHFIYENEKMFMQEITNTLPDGYRGNNICSDLHLSPNGKYLYASNRGHDSITCYQIDDEGRLSMIQNISSGGNTPRNFAVDPSGNYILVGNQDSDQIAVFKIAENGTLHQENQIVFETPVCIKFFKRKIR